MGLQKQQQSQGDEQLLILPLGEEKQEQGIRSLPKNLDEALNKMEQDPWIGQTLGSLYTEHYAKRKREEWENYSRQVSEWELGQYLYRI